MHGNIGETRYNKTISTCSPLLVCYQKVRILGFHYLIIKHHNTIAWSI